MLNYLVEVFVYYALVYRCGFRICIVTCLLPSCVFCYFRDVDQINGGGAKNLFQSNRRDILLDECSRYRASRFIGKFEGIGFGEI